jgi:hypothetical protein
MATYVLYVYYQADQISVDQMLKLPVGQYGGNGCWKTNIYNFVVSFTT